MIPTLEEIKQRHRAVNLKIQQIEDSRSDTCDCPVCDDCPFCGGDQSVESRSWVYNSHAAGFQIFGIGEDLERLEAFAHHAYDDIAALLQKIDELQAASNYEFNERYI